MRDQKAPGHADDIGAGMLTSHVKQYSARLVHDMHGACVHGQHALMSMHSPFNVAILDRCRPVVSKPHPSSAPASRGHQEQFPTAQNTTRRVSGIERLKALSQKMGSVKGNIAASHASESVAGFESPEKQKVIDQLAKEEVRQYVRRQRMSAPGQADTQLPAQHNTSRRGTDDRGHDVDQRPAW